jgi:hypothetical protein
MLIDSPGALDDDLDVIGDTLLGRDPEIRYRMRASFTLAFPPRPLKGLGPGLYWDPPPWSGRNRKHIDDAERLVSEASSLSTRRHASPKAVPRLCSRISTEQL